MKRIVLISICVVFAFISVTVLADQNLIFTAEKADFKIEVDGEEKTFDMPIVTINDRTYLPLREMAETLGVGIEWLEDEQKIMIKSGIEFGDGEQLTNINFQLCKSYTIDSGNILKWCALDLEEDSPFTFFYQILDIENLQAGPAEGLNLELIDFNDNVYQNKYLVITVGRELIEMVYEYREGFSSPFAEITLGEEYHDKTMYVYIMDKILLWPSDLTGYNTFYIMNGTEKRCYGQDILELNNQILKEQGTKDFI